MKNKSKLPLFIVVTAIVWALIFIAFGFVLNEYNPTAWEKGSRAGMMLFYLFGSGMVALGIYGD